MLMTVYTVELPSGKERGTRVERNEHGEFEEFEPGYRIVAFYCETCGYEVEVDVHDTHDRRDYGEMC